MPIPRPETSQSPSSFRPEQLKKRPKKAPTLTRLAETTTEVAKNLWKSLTDFITKLSPKESKGLMPALTGLLALFTKDLPGKLSKKNKDAKEKRDKKEKPDSKKEVSKKTAAITATKQNGKEISAQLGVLMGEIEQGPHLRDPYLACDTFAECKNTLLRRGYIKDYYTGNLIPPYLANNPYLLKEPIKKIHIDGRKVSLKESLSEKLIAADKAMYDKTGEHIKITSSLRTNRKQFELYKKLKPENMVVATPGNSFHLLGQAVDVSNWEKAEPYLLAVDFFGGSKGIKNDRVHFSYGELESQKKMLAARRRRGKRGLKKSAA